MAILKTPMEAPHKRTCCVCDEVIPPDQPYKVGKLSIEAAAGLLENIYDPRLVPIWTQLEDGRVQIDICLPCAGHNGRYRKFGD